MEYAKRYFEEVQTIAQTIDLNTIEKMVQIIESVKKQQGRLFLLELVVVRQIAPTQ